MKAKLILGLVNCVLLAAIAGACSRPAHASAPPTVYWLDMKGMSYSQQLATLALEGIVNRRGPLFMVDSRTLFWQWPPADEHWRDYYSAKGFQFKELPDLDAAVSLFRPDLQGVILYDPALDASRYIACTMAGLREAIPIPLSMRSGALAQLPVIADLRNRWRSDDAAYRWAIQNLEPLCAKDMAFSSGRTHPGVELGGDQSVVLGLDYAVYRGAFCFNLSPAAKPTTFYNTSIPGYPDQARLMDEILGQLHHPAAVFGWAEPEPVYARRLSRDGSYVECAGAPNLSFQAAVGKAIPALGNGGDDRPFQLPPAPPTKLRPIAYVTFETNEGDTPKIAASWQAGAWLDPSRGKVPISWGFSAILAKDFPALYHAFASSATPADGFFSGVSGGGYVILNDVSDLDAYAKETGKALKRAGEVVADVWEDGYHPKRLERYARLSGASGISHDPVAGHVGVEYLPDGTPVIFPDASIFYYSPPSPAVFAKTLQQIASTMPKPCFIEAYGGLDPNAPTWYKEVADSLGPGFQVVRLDTMVQLARQAGKLTVVNAPPTLAITSSSLITVALRNQSANTASTQLAWKAPAGWQVTPMTEPPNDLPPHSTSIVRLKIVHSPNAAKGDLVLRDAARGLTYRLTLCPAKLLWENRCADPTDWRPWITSSQAASVSLSRTGVVLQCPNSQPYAAAELPVSANFGGGPLWLEITVGKATHLWALKVRSAGVKADITLIPDTSEIGSVRVNLSQKTGWRGMRRFRLILFASGPGQKVYPLRIKLYRCER